MNRTQQIKEAHPWLSFEDIFKALLYHYQGSIWIKNLERDDLERSMEAFSKIVNLRAEKPLNPL